MQTGTECRPLMMLDGVSAVLASPLGSGDELEYLSSATLTRRKDFLEAEEEVRADGTLGPDMLDAEAAGSIHTEVDLLRASTEEIKLLER